MPCHKQGSKPRPSATPQWVGELETLWIDRSKHVLYLCHHNHNFQWHYDIIILIWSLSSCWIDYHHLPKSAPLSKLWPEEHHKSPPPSWRHRRHCQRARLRPCSNPSPSCSLRHPVRNHSTYNRHGKTSQCSNRSKPKRCFLNFLLQVSIIWLPNCLICSMFRCKVWSKCKT